MARRGRCRCGSVLKFHKRPEGYKTRCPSCGSVVRLNPVAARSTAKKRKASKGIDSNFVPASHLPALPVPAAEPGPITDRTVTCEVCYAIVPALAGHCPDCGSALDLTRAAPSLGVGHSSRSTAILKSLSNRLIFGLLMAGAALLIAAVVLILSSRH